MTGDDHVRWLHAEAEDRLGRKLTRAEHAIDLDADVATMERAKADLHAEIEKEKRRAIRRLIDGGDPALRVTPAMEAILIRLRDAGRRAALAEIRRLDLEPVATYAAVGDRLRQDPRLAPLLDHLTAGLRGVSKRVADEGYTQIIGGDVTGSALARAIDRRVPGALDVASRMVSSPFYAGMGEVYGANLGLFDAWQYSAVMDRGTCPPCADNDGNTYESWEAIMAVLPNGGPYPYCHGGGRCRCRAVPASEDLAVGGAPDGSTKGTVAQRILGDHEDTQSLHRDPATGAYTAERRALHERIIAEYLREGVAGRRAGERRAMFMAGGSGAGKSSVLRKLTTVPEGAVKIDPDEIKDRLPEFREMVRRKERYAARAAHEESSDISKEILRRANKAKMNVIIDGTGNAGTGKFVGKFADQEALGYKVDVLLVDVPTDEAIRRARIRAGGSGSYVPDEIISDIHDSVSARFGEWALTGRPWQAWATDVNPPVLIARSDGHGIEIFDRKRLVRLVAKSTPAAEARTIVDAWARTTPLS